VQTRDAKKKGDCCTLWLRIKFGRGRGKGEKGEKGGGCYYTPLWMVTSSQRKKLCGVSIYCHPWKTRRLCLVNNNRSIIMPVSTVCTAHAGTNCWVYNAGACSGIDLSDMRLVESNRLSVFHRYRVPNCKSIGTLHRRNYSSIYVRGHGSFLLSKFIREILIE